MENKSTPAKNRDPYISQISFTTVGKSKKRETKGVIVALAGVSSDERGLSLIPQQTRVLCKNEIHELITTDEVGAGPNKTVNRMGCIGFFEVTQGGHTGVGDPVFVNGHEIGKIVGFDETHFPNHYNVVILSPKRFSGLESGFNIGDKLRMGLPMRKEVSESFGKGKQNHSASSTNIV